VIAFFSLNGGSGRTTLAVEVAALLAVRGRATAAVGGRGMWVGLVDGTRRNPAAELRLGILLAAAPPAEFPAPPVTHESGLLVARSTAGHEGVAQPVERTIAAVETAGAEVILLDLDCDLGDRCGDALRRCDEVHVVVTPTAGGVLDAYRSTAALRRLGLRERIRYVVNRSRGDHDLAETMADLGGHIGAEIPEDAAFIQAENRHRPVVLAGPGPACAALEGLATAIAGAVGRHPGTAWADVDAV